MINVNHTDVTINDQQINITVSFIPFSVMMEVLSEMWSSAMHPYYWLPSGITWDQIRSDDPAMRMPDADFIYVSIGYGLLALVLRAIFHCLIALPIVTMVGLNPNNDGYVTDCIRILTRLSGKSKMHRFMDTVWRFTFYAVSFTFGTYYIRDTIWYQDFINCWYQFPMHPINPYVRMHYIAEFAFYWSALCITIASTSRKDFWINFIHHVVTLALLSLSWTLNMTRVGSLVLVIHDAADIFLEFGKVLRYLGPPVELLLNIDFAIFIIVWCISRLFFYPLLIYSAIFEGPLIVASIHWPPMIVVLYIMLIVLQILHVIWTGMIARIVANTLKPKGEIGDVRSESEDSEPED